jgi:hypothetical protein
MLSEENPGEMSALLHTREKEVKRDNNKEDYL